MSDGLIGQWRGRIREAAQSGVPLRLRGGGSKDFYGRALIGELLDTTGYRGVVDYEPTELVVTARCGTPLAELEAVLAREGQTLPFEPPAFGGAATVGGVLASGLAGPRRQAVGAVRDFVLGVQLIDGRGELLQFGGRVMKNVAGYDVSRLMAGALGTLGLITEVSFKVLPRPAAEATLRFELSQADALDHMNRWGGQPLPVSSTAWCDGVLHLRLSGARAALAAARVQLGGEPLDEAAAQAFWQDLREQRAPFFQGDAPLWRLALPSTCAPLALPAAPLLEWGGAVRWLRGNGDREGDKEGDADALRSTAQAAGGHATLFRGGDKSAGVFHPLAPALAGLHRRLKAQFDPAGILNPGRMYPEF